MSEHPQTTQGQNNSKLIVRLVGVVVGMFAFGFALVPLYDVFCDLTGINGKTRDSAVVYESVEVDKDRLVTVEFITRINKGMPWKFEVEQRRMKVHPGEMHQINFFAHNPATRDIVGQAIPSVSPGTAALYLNKTECFCFEQQPLEAGQKVTMPMSFYVDPQLPDDITYFTLQYTLYDVTSTAEVALNRG